MCRLAVAFGVKPGELLQFAVADCIKRLSELEEEPQAQLV
jgi:hypothetical protein